jgi:hypothetical protein
VLRHNALKRSKSPDGGITAGNMLNLHASDVSVLPYCSPHEPVAGQNTTEARWTARELHGGWVGRAGGRGEPGVHNLAVAAHHFLRRKPNN